MEEKRCFTEGNQQGTGEEEACKAKGRKRSQTMFGEGRSKSFYYVIRIKKLSASLNPQYFGIVL